MYKLLLVDDEKIIREGILNLIDWNRLGLEVDEARNGLEAYEKICKDQPHIVITDVKMPELNGLELLEKVKLEYPNIIFIILSGFGEFKFARKAMKYGVKHYLLKPTDEKEISHVLESVINELVIKNKNNNIQEKMKKKLKVSLESYKEKFFRDCITGKIDSLQKKNYFANIFSEDVEKIYDIQFYLVLIELKNMRDYQKYFDLKQRLYSIFDKKTIFIDTIIEKQLVVLMRNLSFKEIYNKLEIMKKQFYSVYSGNVINISISSKNSYKNVLEMYKEAQSIMKYKFYLGYSKIINIDDVKENIKYVGKADIKLKINKICEMINNGDKDETNIQLKEFFEYIYAAKLEPTDCKKICTKLFLSIIRNSNAQEASEYINKIIIIEKSITLDQIKEFIIEISMNIVEIKQKEKFYNYSKYVQKMLGYIEQNIYNPNLTLSYIAKKVLFMNEDYLGRLFKKELNQKFSQYIILKKVEEAKKMIKKNNDIKVYEICDKLGYEANNRYFSCLFKKYTGYTIQQYKANKKEI